LARRVGAAARVVFVWLALTGSVQQRRSHCHPERCCSEAVTAFQRGIDAVAAIPEEVVAAAAQSLLSTCDPHPEAEEE